MIDLRTAEQVRLSEPTAGWLALPWTPAAAGLARRHVTDSLRGAEPDVVDVAVLLTSELVANAVRHGLAPVRLQLHRQHGVVRVEVHDAGVSFARPPATTWSLTDEGGRGLPLLDALAAAWGSQADRGTGDGKTVWFELPDDQPAPLPADPSLAAADAAALVLASAAVAGDARAGAG